MGAGLITPHFSIAEMQCRCNNPNCERKNPDMNADMMKMLEELRLATFALPVSSGARCLDHDISISPKKNKLGGQNKIPRLANNRNYLDDILSTI